MTAIRKGIRIIMGSAGDLVEERAQFMNCCGGDGKDVKRQEGMILRG